MSENEALRILAIGAHPDDIEFGCGGILLKEARRGTEIVLALATRGESGTHGTSEERVREAEAAAAHLGAALCLLDLGSDGLVEANRTNALALAGLMRKLRPHLALAPTGESNQHPDHVAVAALARDAARLARFGGLSALKEQEAWAIGALRRYAITPGAEPQRRPDYLIDISGFEGDWEGLMRCHQSQMKTRRYVDLQLARARAWGLQLGGGAAQALWSDDSLVAEHLGAIARDARSF